MSRAAIVTGAAGDLGRAIAERLSADGWQLFVTDHPAAAEGLAATAERCRSRGAEVVESTFDVTESAQVEAAVERCVANLGPPTGLVNNAGYQGRFEPVHEYPIGDVARVVAVNVVGVFDVLATTARAMIAGGVGGAIVNMASMAGVSGAPNMPAYSASKAAVLGLTKSAAKDLAPHGIRVNCVSPAFIGPGRMWETQVAQQAAAGSQYYSTEPGTVAEQMIALVPLRRLGTPAEVADGVAFLLGPQSSYVTGTNLEVTGGSV